MKKGSKRSSVPSVAEALRVALRVDKDGCRTIVPVFGSGLNIQAANVQNQTEDDWSGLLLRIAVKMRLSQNLVDSLPGSNLGRWESLLRMWARINQIEPYQAENQLQRFACESLREAEQAARGWQLYREVVDARFADIISLNFDRRIALSSGRTSFVHAPGNCREGAQGETLYRHDRFSHPDGNQTRVWYPHGDTNKFSTLKLGVRRYGFHLVTLEESRQGFGDYWRVKRSWEQSVEHEYRVGQGGGEAPKWTDIFLNRPLIFVGCGLSLDEWALWWMIRTRWQVMASIGKKQPPDTIYIGVSKASSDPVLEQIFMQYGIIALEFDSFGDLWKAVRLGIS
jgi:hypothetical protein